MVKLIIRSRPVLPLTHSRLDPSRILPVGVLLESVDCWGAIQWPGVRIVGSWIDHQAGIVGHWRVLQLRVTANVLTLTSQSLCMRNHVLSQTNKIRNLGG